MDKACDILRGALELYIVLWGGAIMIYMVFNATPSTFLLLNLLGILAFTARALLAFARYFRHRGRGGDGENIV